MQIDLQSKDSSCRPPQGVGYTYLNGNLVPTKDQSFETIERIVKFFRELWNVTKNNNFSQSAASKIQCKNKRNEVLKKKKKNILVDQERHESIRIENLKLKLNTTMRERERLKRVREIREKGKRRIKKKNDGIKRKKRKVTK